MVLADSKISIYRLELLRTIVLIVNNEIILNKPPLTILN
jgi:hypothetical protein